ncbi:MAG: hypothetical protein GY777_24360 [Candidatus Brocadiaceae bacterium]|nr:hypothetical protein [Candidatus Brocadiaceae bacterium]
MTLFCFKDVLKATNVFPSPQYAQNIYNDNRTQTVIDPVVLKVLAKAFNKDMQFMDMNEEDVIEDSG